MQPPLPTRYLLRLDDACPTWNRDRWEWVLKRTTSYGIKPILGVLPDNQDPDLICGEADADFWPRMRQLAAGGASIALHGYRHLAMHAGGGLLPLHQWTEFAGAPLQLQRAWIRAGLALLRAQNLEPALWIAPRHGQDNNTLRALAEAGISVLSDGLAHVPYRRGGMVWLPQQLWAPKEMGPGLWTFLIHPNTATDPELQALDSFLAAHRQEFVDLSTALELFPPTHSYFPFLWFGEWCRLTRIRWARTHKRRQMLRRR